MYIFPSRIYLTEISKSTLVTIFIFLYSKREDEYETEWFGCKNRNPIWSRITDLDTCSWDIITYYLLILRIFVIRFHFRLERAYVYISNNVQHENYIQVISQYTKRCFTGWETNKQYLKYYIPYIKFVLSELRIRQ